MRDDREARDNDFRREMYELLASQYRKLATDLAKTGEAA